MGHFLRGHTSFPIKADRISGLHLINIHFRQVLRRMRRERARQLSLINASFKSQSLSIIGFRSWAVTAVEMRGLMRFTLPAIFRYYNQ